MISEHELCVRRWFYDFTKEHGIRPPKPSRKLPRNAGVYFLCNMCNTIIKARNARRHAKRFHATEVSIADVHRLRRNARKNQPRPPRPRAEGWRALTIFGGATAYFALKQAGHL